MLWGCNSTKHLPEEQFLLGKVTVRVDNKKNSSDPVMEQIIQKPNSRIFGFPLRLHIHNLATPNPQQNYLNWLERNPNSKKVLDAVFSEKQTYRIGNSFVVAGYNNILKDIGEPPVPYSGKKTELSEARLQNYYFDRGYFDVEVCADVDTLFSKREVLVGYEVDTLLSNSGGR